MLAELVAELWPLHRTLVSDGTDEALRILGDYLPSAAGYCTETYTSGQSAWTWRVPERYVVHEAYLEVVGGNRIADFSDTPLHVVSYSEAIDRIMDWDELEPHLHYSDRRPDAVPWEFKYYERDWGFCVSKSVFDRLPRDAEYRAVIRSEFLTNPSDGLRVGVCKVDPQGPRLPEAGEIVVCAHICHPCQANDNISGVVTAVEVARRLVERPLPKGSMAVRFLFAPETIGSVCYLSRHEDLIEQIRGGIVCDTTGNRNRVALQRSRQDNDLMDRIARYVLRLSKKPFHEGPFGDAVLNDEMVINGPGVDVPCISLSRWPYDEYHTSDDTPEIVHEDVLLESADIVEEIVRVSASNYCPIRRFRGRLFLSGSGLWVDWRVNEELNRAIEKITHRLDGEHTVFDIADDLGLDYWETRGYLGRFVEKGLARATPVRSVSKTG